MPTSQPISALPGEEGGFTGLKLRLGRERGRDDVATIEAVRKVVGEDMALMVDFNQGLHLGEALQRCHIIDDLGLAWIEEPIVYENTAGFRPAYRRTDSPSQNCAARKLTVVWCVIRHEMIEMRRREVMLGLTAAVGWPPSARAQQRQLPRIGLLGVHKGSFDGIVRSLAERGYVDGKTVVIEQRQAEGQLERLPALARELVSLPVEIIVSVPAAATAAARQATATIPIVMVHANEPGLIESLARPGGNVTGTTSYSPELVGKAVGLLRELVPAISRLAVLVVSSNIGTPLTVREAQGCSH